VAVEIPVAWGDMDAFGHVNNTVFHRWFETARIAYFEQIGLLDRMERDRVGPILAKATCDFRLAVRYPDGMRVESTVTALGTSSFVMGYRAHSGRQGVVAAEGESVIVLFDYSAERKVPLDPGLRGAIERLEAQGSGRRRS
jgi:acyl-CoA thioester hydrolase